MLLLGGECKPFVTPPQHPLLSPQPWRGQGWPGGHGNPQDEEIREQWPSGHQEAPDFRGKGWVGLDPALTLFPPRSSPSKHSRSPGELGAKCWCFHLPGGGRREGQPFGETPPWGSSENGAILPGQSHLPLPTRTHPWLWSSWYPSIENLKLDSITPSLGPLGPLSPHQSLFPMSEAPSD